MENRYKIPVPIVSAMGLRRKLNQPAIGRRSKLVGGRLWQIRAFLTLKSDGERRLRTKELVYARLPRKTSKLQLIVVRTAIRHR